ncbi:hypothetical protein GOODEAATRI_014402 [Goodea atripinnis]|uniref:Uncharacterized protein n=1 Tax=Goodea atripinnis TaxID=208336 RepID=A0ABV0PE22_9TELE
MSGRVDTTAQATPTNSATTRLTTIQGRKICCSEPGGLQQLKEGSHSNRVQSEEASQGHGRLGQTCRMQRPC